MIAVLNVSVSHLLDDWKSFWIGHFLMTENQFLMNDWKSLLNPWWLCRTTISRHNVLFLLQKKIVSILTGSDYRAHSESLFIELKIINVFQLHQYFTGIFVLKCISNMYFKYWNNLFHQSNNLKYFKNKIAQSSVQYSGHTHGRS